MSDLFTCEICGVDGRDMYEGWGGYTCRRNPECRPPLSRPRQREVATLTEEMLDGLEWAADEGENTCCDSDVKPEVLRALIDAARRELSRDPDDVPIAEWVAGRGRRAIALANPGG